MRPELCVVDEVVAEEKVVVQLAVDERPLVSVGPEHDGHRAVIAVLEHFGRGVVLLQNKISLINVAVVNFG